MINSTLVLHYTGTYGMGLFAMVVLATAAMEVVPAALAQVLYPRMAQEYGAGRDTRHLVRISIKPMLATFCRAGRGGRRGLVRSSNPSCSS